MCTANIKQTQQLLVQYRGHSQGCHCWNSVWLTGCVTLSYKLMLPVGVYPPQDFCAQSYEGFVLIHSFTQRNGGRYLCSSIMGLSVPLYSVLSIQSFWVLHFWVLSDSVLKVLKGRWHVVSCGVSMNMPGGVTLIPSSWTYELCRSSSPALPTLLLFLFLCVIIVPLFCSGWCVVWKESNIFYSNVSHRA